MLHAVAVLKCWKLCWHNQCRPRNEDLSLGEKLHVSNSQRVVCKNTVALPSGSEFFPAHPSTIRVDINKRVCELHHVGTSLNKWNCETYQDLDGTMMSAPLAASVLPLPLPFLSYSRANPFVKGLASTCMCWRRCPFGPLPILLPSTLCFLEWTNGELLG